MTRSPHRVGWATSSRRGILGGRGPAAGATASPDAHGRELMSPPAADDLAYLYLTRSGHVHTTGVSLLDDEAEEALHDRRWPTDRRRRRLEGVLSTRRLA